MNKKPLRLDKLLLSTEDSAAIDREAQEKWGFNGFALVEAAGRLCAQRFTQAFPAFFDRDSAPNVVVAAGTGNNAADALVMLRHWILSGLVHSASSTVLVSRLSVADTDSPRAQLLKSLTMMNVPVVLWNKGIPMGHLFAQADIILDGIAGTGLKGALEGSALEMAAAVNTHEKPFVVSVDIPSGSSDQWKPGMPIINADLTLAIEPQKLCLYTPAARPYAGNIITVGAVFPREIAAGYAGAELADWESAQKTVSKIRPDAYKHKRGTVEIRAGSPGATGAALIAARGAQAAGAGLVRLVVDDDIYPILASQAAGIMVFPAAKSAADGNADAILLGPGWGKTENRLPVLERALEREKTGTPLILDADAIELAREKVFGGNTILTPHPGELSAFSGITKEELLCRPAPLLRELACQQKAVIIFKGHVITVAAPDGRLAVLDGMTPVLAAGGSGDLLAGFCAAIAARMVREGVFCAYTCAGAAAALLVETGNPKRFKPRFTDPMELAARAAELAAQAWLPV